jgi:hypothetical protein
MISRREVVTAGVLGSLATGGSAEARELQEEVTALKSGLSSISSALGDIKSSLDQGLRGSSMNYGNVGSLKNTIQKYARLSGKFPDYCEIGIDVFYDVYDWHVQHNQQIQISRIAEQRIMILFMFTQLILRWENEPNYIGTPY